MVIITNSRYIDFKNSIHHPKNSLRYKTTVRNASNFCHGIGFHCLF